MKTKIKSLSATAVAALFLFTLSCKEKKETNTVTSTEEHETVQEPGKEYTSAYVCPMHCEGSGSDSEGTCPKCGMDYVANDEHTKDGHTH
jgi:hypothetical protein